MQKEYDLDVTITLDTATVEYLYKFKFLLGSEHSRRTWYQNLVKDNFEEIMESEDCYIDEPYDGFDAFPKTVHFFPRVYEESPELLDSIVNKTGMSHSSILRWLVIRELRKLELHIRQNNS